MVMRLSRRWTSVFAGLALLFSAATEGAVVQLEATTATPGGAMVDLAFLTLNAPSRLHIQGSFQNIVGPELNVTQKAQNGDFTSYAFTASPFDLITDVLAAGNYTFGAFAYSVGNASDPAWYDLTISSVPVPAAVWLFGSAILGFAVFTAARRSH